MQITSSYSVEIRKQGLCFRKTFEAYRSAAACLITVFDSVWEELEAVGNAKREAPLQYRGASRAQHKEECRPV